MNSSFITSRLGQYFVVWCLVSIDLLSNRELVAFLFLVPRDCQCSASIHSSTIGRSAVCECGIFWLH